ncbi:D-alanine--D-alanine ligase [Candidatus Bipolaricaulota bacterium]|nr:D-alanine--D-alanine ligase [Candidatus Bipolaricaulota bacterium]
MDYGKIGVIAGGDSSERAISLLSGEHVTTALTGLGYHAALIEIDNLDNLIPPLRKVDTVFNCLHGGTGEDGTVQILLDVLEIPYPGSGPQASALAMDKPRAKEVLTRNGIAVPRGYTYQGEEIDLFCARAQTTLGYPLICKPSAGGSSVGVWIVESESVLVKAAAQIIARFGSLLIEEHIAGHELTVGVLHRQGVGEALPVIEIKLADRLFTYKDKYSAGVAEFLVPAPLDQGTAARVQKVGLAAHCALGCVGFSRIDLRLSADGIPYVLEVNTLPGITLKSLLPLAAAAVGITFPQLVETMLETTLIRKSCGQNGSDTPAS